MKTFEEVRDLVGLSRRAIQEYEAAGLAKKPETRNKYGYLLYDDEAVERLWQLRFYKELGKRIPDIEEIERKNFQDKQKEMDNVIAELEKKRADLDNLIAIAQSMRSTGLDFNSMRRWILPTDTGSNSTLGLMGAGLRFLWQGDSIGINEEVLTDELYDRVFLLVNKIAKCSELQLEYNSKKVQNYVKRLHVTLYEVCTESASIFKSMAIGIVGESRQEGEIDDEQYEYLMNAIQCYCSDSKEDPIKKVMSEALDNIERLGRQKYTSGSVEVQAEVGKICEIFLSMKIFKEEDKFEVMRRQAVYWGSKEVKMAVDGGREKGLAWFISRAFTKYCDNMSKEKDGE